MEWGPCTVQVMSRSSHPSSGVRSAHNRLPAAQLPPAAAGRPPACSKLWRFAAKVRYGELVAWFSRARARVRPNGGA